MLGTITYFIRRRAVSGWLTIQMTVTWIHPFLELLLKSGDYELRYGEIRTSLHTAPLSVLPQAQTRSSVTCRPGVIVPNTQPPAFSNISAAKLMFNCAFSMWLHLLSVLTGLKQFVCQLCYLIHRVKVSILTGYRATAFMFELFYEAGNAIATITGLIEVEVFQFFFRVEKWKS